MGGLHHKSCDISYNKHQTESIICLHLFQDHYLIENEIILCTS